MPLWPILAVLLMALIFAAVTYCAQRPHPSPAPTPLPVTPISTVVIVPTAAPPLGPTPPGTPGSVVITATPAAVLPVAGNGGCLGFVSPMPCDYRGP